MDAGANVGYSALFFARQYPNATVIAIEPNEANLKSQIIYLQEELKNAIKKRDEEKESKKKKYLIIIL